jgi:alanine dehydrogenase
MIHIDFDTVHRLAAVGDTVAPLRRVFLSNAVSPPRAHYDLGALDRSRTLLLMPSWQPDGYIGVKIATVFADNAARGLPSVNAAYVLLSGNSGQPCAWMDGRALTLIRTAGVSALAADLLAPSAPAVLLMVGTGVLSRYLIEGHLAVRRYESVLIWGRDRAKAAAVARELDARGWPVSVAGDLEAAARSADVISCATLAEQPLVKGAWLKSVCHLDLVGSFKPGMREADDDCLRGATLIVDTLTALEECGELMLPLAAGVIAKESVVSLNGLLKRPAAARPRPDRTVFKSVGVAQADLAVAQFLFERHHALGA